MRRTLALAGMCVGLVVSVVAMVDAYVHFPGVPGVFELMLQVVFLALSALILGALGYGIGFIIDWLRKK